MEDKPIDTQDTNPATTKHLKNAIGLPLIALGLALAPLLLVFLGSLGLWLPSGIILVMILSPIFGLILGIVSLNEGIERIGKVGKTLAIAAIISPLSFVAFTLILFMGVATGRIPLM